MSVLRVLSVSAGTAAIIVAIFLYEDDERKLQRVLENSWVKVADAEASVHRSITLFLQLLARWAADLLTQLFGERLFSSRALGVSFCLTTLSVLVGCLMIVPLSNHLFWPLIEDHVTTGTQLLLHTWITSSESYRTILVLGVLALSWSVWISSRLPHAPATTLLYFLFILMVWQPAKAPHVGWTGTAANVVPVGIGVAAVSVALFAFGTVAAVRGLLQRQVATTTPATVVLYVLLFVVIAVALVVLPITGLSNLPECDGCLRQHSRLDESGAGVTFSVVSTRFYPIWYAANALFACLLSSVYVVPIVMLVPLLMCALLLHRLAWKVLERPVYAIQRFGVFRHRKALAATGLALIALGSPRIGAIFQAFAKIVLG